MTTHLALLFAQGDVSTTLPFQDPSQIVALLSGLVLPLLVGVVTKYVAHPGVKALSLLFLTAASQYLNTLWTSAGGWNLQLFLWNVFVAFVLGVAVHFGVYKPTGTSEAVQQSTRNFGIG